MVMPGRRCCCSPERRGVIVMEDQRSVRSGPRTSGTISHRKPWTLRAIPESSTIAYRVRPFFAGAHPAYRRLHAPRWLPSFAGLSFTTERFGIFIRRDERDTGWSRAR